MSYESIWAVHQKGSGHSNKQSINQCNGSFDVDAIQQTKISDMLIQTALHATTNLSDSKMSQGYNWALSIQCLLGFRVGKTCIIIYFLLESGDFTLFRHSLAHLQP